MAPQLTERGYLVLRYLDDKPWASSAQIGFALAEAIADRRPRTGEFCRRSAAAVLGRLHLGHQVSTVVEPGLWRITPRGRETLSTRLF